MKSATGSTILLYLVIIMVGIIGSIIIGSNAYSKAYKAKNNIVTIIDKYYEVDNKTCFDDEGDANCISDISSSLNNMGYNLNTSNPCNSNAIINKYGGKININNLVYPVNNENFRGYCIYKNEIDDGYYYSIVTYSYLNMSILGTIFKTPVYGETRTYRNIE